ncbi:MAG: XRE family transcriptional regulator [Alphaproteobacteria bacterium]|nr:MAG: XRE family transcriptional regulator [Alphaproteobacteria bacterium]
MAITAAQSRAGRALLNMTQEELSLAAGVATKTIATFESEGTAPREATLVKLQIALEGAGVIFIESAGGAGVMVRTAH